MARARFPSGSCLLHRVSLFASIKWADSWCPLNLPLQLHSTWSSSHPALAVPGWELEASNSSQSQMARSHQKTGPEQKLQDLLRGQESSRTGSTQLTHPGPAPNHWTGPKVHHTNKLRFLEQLQWNHLPRYINEKDEDQKGQARYPSHTAMQGQCGQELGMQGHPP